MRRGASRAAESDPNGCGENGVQPVHAAWARTSEVCVVLTTPCATQSAARVARDLARALAAPLTFIVFTRASRDGQMTPAPDQEEEAQALVKELRAEGDTVTSRAYVCHSVRQAIPFAFSPRSLVVLGGRHSWLPTRTERLRHALERAQHFVIVVDDGSRREGEGTGWQ
jgi:K+-sensing histidine kinase KdpD